MGGGFRGKPKTWKTLRVEGSGWNWMGKISTSPRYVIDITETEPIPLEELGEGGQFLKIRKMRHF